MRKFIAICFIGSLLNGCSDDKLTNDKLVGDWECELNHYESSWENGKFTPYIKQGSAEVIKMSYKKDGDKYYVSKNNNGWEEADFELMQNKGITKKDDNIASYTTTNSITIENNKILTLSNQIELIFKNEKYSNKNNKEKNEAICTRIK